MSIFTKHLKGILVPHKKTTMDMETVAMPIPEQVCISMVQHIGAPCIPLVSPGDHVKVGQVIGETDAFISAPIHSSVSGAVIKIEDIMSSLGTKDQTIIIETDGKQKVWERIQPPKVSNREEFIKAVRNSGLVGLGGAAFPTHVKYNPKNIEEVDTLIVNGAECEPYITSDYRTMMEDTDDIINGILIVMKYLDLKRCLVGIEDNKPKAIALLKEKTEKYPEIEIVTLRSRYPQGAERVLIYETTGKVVAPGKLPADVGVIVSNITSVAFVSKYFETGMPLIEKRITVDGDAIAEPKNIYALLGVQIYDIVAFCGGYKSPPKKILMGGPMMGRAVYSDTKAIIKNNNAIIAFDEDQARAQAETQCLNCGRCIQTCPIDLKPTLIYKEYNRGNLDALEKLRVSICMECGSCEFACPARKQLALINRLSKKLLKERSEK